MSGYVFDPYEDIYDQGFTAVGSPVMGIDFAETVADDLDALNRKEAAAYIRSGVYLLDSYEDSDTLWDMFDWKESRQGYAFWNECYNEMVSAGTDSYPVEVRELQK